MGKERFWEIDSLRGLALIKMLIFNYSFVVFYLGIYKFKEGLIFPGLAAVLFIFLVGFCLTISYNRVKKWKPKQIYKKYFTRGLKIFGYGVLITIITYLTFPEAFVFFGILHFIGVSIILGQFFLKFKRLNLFLGLSIIALGFYLRSFRFDFPWLFWLGFAPKNFYTFDYFPLLPWFGITLIGIFFGNLLYKNGKRRFKIKDLSDFFAVKFLAFLGRHSLIIYLAHQPILILILLIMGFNVFHFG